MPGYLRFMVLGLLLCLGTFAVKAQTRHISGRILDNAGGVPGASVVVKGTTNGVSTDQDGNFTLDVPATAVLHITAVGYIAQDIGVANRLVFNVVLTATAKGLQDVVLVGYGQIKKANLTGAVDQVSAKALQDRPITRLSQGLQGLVANLNIGTSSGAPNATQSFNIRGYTGLGTAGSPLIVIDGVQGGDVNGLNAADVESVTVIKDAAASAVYGSSAPYGVILIKTKQGRRGQKPVITYDNNLSFAVPVGLPKMLNSIDFANIYNEAGKNGGGSPYYADDVIQRMKDYQAGKIKDETIAAPGNQEWLSWFGANGNNDWFKIYFKDAAFSQIHNINVTGGSETTNYYIGTGYTDRPGMYRYGNDYYKRFNLKTNLSVDLAKYLTFNFRGSYSKELYNSPQANGNRTGGNYMHQIGRKHPNIALHNPNGEYAETSDIPFMTEGGRVGENWDKPTLTGEFIARLAPGWTATANFTYDSYFTKSTNQTKTLYWTAPNGVRKPVDWTSPNWYQASNARYASNVINAFTNYDRVFGKHDLKVLAGYVQEYNSTSSYTGSNSYLYSDNVPSLSLAYGTTPSVSDNSSAFAVQGFFGRVNYAYDDKYLLEVVSRYDGTSRFLKDVRWKLYPGLSVGWNVQKENFWGDQLRKYFSQLKFRASYGTSGDQSGNVFGNYPFFPSLGTNAPTNTNWLFAGGKEASVTSPRLVDPNITWITTKTLNGGVDMGFFNNRLNASLDIYRRKMTDYVGPGRDLPAVLGTSVPVANNAALETKGFELTLGWRDKAGSFGYGIRGLLSSYSGRVLSYPNTSGTLNNWRPGEEMGEIWGYVTDRYFTNADDFKTINQLKFNNWTPGDIKYKDLNGDGVVDWGNNTISNPGDMKIIGNSTPKFAYSILLDANWKNFDIQLFGQGIGKRDYFMGSNYYFGITGSEWQSSLFTEHLDRWTETNTNGFFPKYYLGGSFTDRNEQAQTKYLLNLAYFRLKNIQIGYSLPTQLIKKAGLTRVRVYLSGDNIATIAPVHKHAALDPELSFSEGKNYPLQAVYSFGLSVSF